MPRYMKTPYSIESRRAPNAGAKNGAKSNLSGKNANGARNALVAESVVTAAEVDLSEVMEAIRALERKIDGHPAEPGAAEATAAAAAAENVGKQDQKIEEIRTEISEIAGRIQATKVEIAALRHPLSNEDKFESATEELSEIVRQTETATDGIMNSAEKIEEVIADLLTVTTDEYANSRLGDIADLITGIYEACNFQDLTGQRINKVIKVLNYIEERVDAMMATWDIREFQTMPLPKDITRKDEDLTLSGPMAEGQAISQDEIDALFD
ncbi:protein phosphatase CheZ [Nisaea sp.]|uniref:protein phosphatase CheZ n=1 Tax=Nisaea sp. TaxID=2024842 RepID=UPI002B26BE25|nr:protein phosphatase CheZ [Nisaea sp.]